MGLFRRKPSIVEAVEVEKEGKLYTAAGIFDYKPGDWLLSANGEKWICEKDAFPKLYDPCVDISREGAG